MAYAQAQSTASEEQVRNAIAAGMQAQGGVVALDQPGRLVMELGGSVGKAYLAGGFRDKMKMPMELVVSTAAGAGGTGVTIDVHSRGTGSGFMSGGWLGSIKQSKAEQIWLRTAWEAVPDKVGQPEAPQPGQGQAPAAAPPPA